MLTLIKCPFTYNSGSRDLTPKFPGGGGGAGGCGGEQGHSWLIVYSLTPQNIPRVLTMPALGNAVMLGELSHG